MNETANSENSNDSDHINLKTTLDAGFSTEAPAEQETFGLGIFTGVSIVILLEVIVAGGLYLYMKKAANKKRSETREAELEDSQFSNRDLNRSVPAEEENFASVTLKNLSGNLSVDRSTTEQNKIAFEVQA